MKTLMLFVLILNLIQFISCQGILTDAMKKGVVKLGEACMKQVGATEEEVNGLRAGPPYQGKAACVLACIFDKAGIMQNKTFSKKGFMFAVTPFIFTEPKKIKRMQEISTQCESETAKVSLDECETANNVVACLRKQIPQISEIKF